MEISLDGKWKLYYFLEDSEDINNPADLKKHNIPSVPAQVPGEVQLDLSRAGVLPADLFMGLNIMETERFENFEWWYEKEFTPKKPLNDDRAILIFGGVDCYAEYYLNGKKFAQSANMFLEQRFDVTELLDYDQVNTLHVNIKSPTVTESRMDFDINTIADSWRTNSVGVYSRRAPHSYGWDIMPRAVTSGFWRPVKLSYEKINRFNQLFVRTFSINGDNAVLDFIYEAVLKPEQIGKPLTFKVEGRCKDSSFSGEYTGSYKTGSIRINVQNAKKWWPRPYGEPNLYNTVCTLSCEGEVIATQNLWVGIRTAELVRTETTDGKNGSFHFKINGEKVMAVGTNWVPLDAFHSRDAERYEPALRLVDDIGCNIVRCWGGNVYEDKYFYDFCDSHGIMIWQDFMMACKAHPLDNNSLDIIRKEAEHIVRLLRNHPSLVLWAGDNECDQMYISKGKDPSKNIITRRVLPEVIDRCDSGRCYLPSSPYISPQAVAEGPSSYTEDHLWGPRDYFKSNYYNGSNAHFVSECGYHGCPSRESIEKFIEKDYIWPYKNNPQWNLHSTMQNVKADGRTMLMHRQVKQLFHDVPDNLDDYALASQISQAEAKKFFIERIRTDMEHKGGVIWWNLLDGWPQMSDAVVDYYFNKKLAYDFIKRSSAPFIITLREMNSWGQEIVTANSTFDTVSGRVKITDLDSGSVVFEKEFTAAANANTLLGKIELMYSDKGMFKIEWETDKFSGFNTYLYGSPAFDLQKYKTWLEKIK